MVDITLISCSYNTPQVTLTMLRSFFAHHTHIPVLISENSSDDRTLKLLELHNIPFIINKNGLHIRSIDPLLERVRTSYALLVDTDIIFLKNCNDVFEDFKRYNLALLGEICGDRGGKKIHNRVHPWFCFIDVNKIKNNNITFFNPQKHNRKDGKLYDVGCTFFSDILDCKLKIGDINLENDYFKHYEGMSWRTERYGECAGDIDLDHTATHNNRYLYECGLRVWDSYLPEISKYENVVIPRNL